MRDIDSILRECLEESKDGGFLLIVGDSTAGKTRSLYEALLKVVPQARVIAPSTGGSVVEVLREVRSKPQSCVLWLDDLERYLGPGAVEPFLVGELIRSGVCIAATLRAERYEAYIPQAEKIACASSDTASQHVARVGLQVLNIAELIEINRSWSNHEIEAAEECDDPRVEEAVKRHGPYGIAEYLAAGPPLHSEWKRALRANGNPRGHALVAAAVDLARAGVIGPIATSTLRDLHEIYLDRAGGSLLRPERFEVALKWASDVRYGVTSLLMPAGEGTWRPFDYLVDTVSRENVDFPEGDAVWKAAISITDSHWQRFSVALAAFETDNKKVAEEIWIDLAAEDDGHAAFHLAELFKERGEVERQESWLRSSVAAGNKQSMLLLGELLIEQKLIGEAEEWLIRGLALGEADCAWHLGKIRASVGDVSGAEELWQTGLDMGSQGAGTSLGISLARRKGHGSAIAVFREVVEKFNKPGAQFNLGRALMGAGDTENAKIWYRKAANEGYAAAQINLGMLHAEEGDYAAALELLMKSVEAEDWMGVCHAADIQSLLGNIDEAFRLYQLSFENGHLHSAEHLGVLCLRSRDIPGAKRWFRMARKRGSEAASWNLAVMQLAQGFPDEQLLAVCSWPL
ncbi:tetratricopeptide repeat protein [Streptomyces angustmyceticus]|uniref:tetratricopeptide repeat protein n=1 Tax=Streptomyces angustmyceticus TaxID=285578 RepID=UPI00344C829D